MASLRGPFVRSHWLLLPACLLHSSVTPAVVLCFIIFTRQVTKDEIFLHNTKGRSQLKGQLVPECQVSQAVRQGIWSELVGTGNYWQVFIIWKRHKYCSSSDKLSSSGSLLLLCQHPPPHPWVDRLETIAHLSPLCLSRSLTVSQPSLTHDRRGSPSHTPWGQALCTEETHRGAPLSSRKSGGGWMVG